MSKHSSDREVVLPEPLAATKRLSRQLVEETGIDGAGVAVFATASTRDLVFATDVVAEELDEMQFAVGEGPCLDAYRFARPELHDDMAGGAALTRWPVFSTQATGLGAASVYAYPLDGGEGTTFGVLELYGRAPVAMAPREDAVCRLFAQSVARAVVTELDPAFVMMAGSDDGVFRRGNVQIASGMLAARFRISVEEAVVRLRAMAFSQQRRITAVAHDIIGGGCFDADAS
ncbi:GAF and ANTAR domain-containing protein [Rhodococcus sp. 24CO]|uniref:GAF and ANTAR domain-containing protein n=1 Tax=Rhodococcus sp. 24CO TaxID=3117460 RepID=UPI003D3383EC